MNVGALPKFTATIPVGEITEFASDEAVMLNRSVAKLATIVWDVNTFVNVYVVVDVGYTVPSTT